MSDARDIFLCPHSSFSSFRSFGFFVGLSVRSLIRSFPFFRSRKKRSQAVLLFLGLVGFPLTYTLPTRGCVDVLKVPRLSDQPSTAFHGLSLILQSKLSLPLSRLEVHTPECERRREQDDVQIASE